MLFDSDNRRLLLDNDDCVRALVAEDIDAVFDLTRLVTTKDQLRAFCKEELNLGRARAVMSGENHAELASRLNQKVPAMDSCARRNAGCWDHGGFQCDEATGVAAVQPTISRQQEETEQEDQDR